MIDPSNDADANATVAKLQDLFGFDTVDAGQLSESWRIDRDQPAYIARQDVAELEANLRLATR